MKAGNVLIISVRESLIKQTRLFTRCSRCPDFGSLGALLVFAVYFPWSWSLPNPLETRLSLNSCVSKIYRCSVFDAQVFAEEADFNFKLTGLLAMELNVRYSFCDIELMC